MTERTKPSSWLSEPDFSTSSVITETGVTIEDLQTDVFANSGAKIVTCGNTTMAVWMAADCNHDGVIDQLDVDLLNQAGVLLSSVDQTKPTEELLETSAEYNEYLSLIDQMGSEETPETPTQDENDSFFTRIIALIESIIKFVNKIFTKIF